MLALRIKHERCSGPAGGQGRSEAVLSVEADTEDGVQWGGLAARGVRGVSPVVGADL